MKEEDIPKLEELLKDAHRINVTPFYGETIQTWVNDTIVLFRDSKTRKRGKSLGDNHKGTACPYKALTCQEGYCDECGIYLRRS